MFKQYYREGDMLDDRFVNYRNFTNAIVLLFSCATGENWYQVMFDCYKLSGAISSIIFYIFFIVIVRFIMLNLFILIILE